MRINLKQFHCGRVYIASKQEFPESGNQPEWSPSKRWDEDDEEMTFFEDFIDLRFPLSSISEIQLIRFSKHTASRILNVL